MRRAILAASLIFAIEAQAQGAPPGCYATYDNPNYCYGFTLGRIYGTLQENLDRYGWLVGNLAWDLSTIFDERAACQDQYGALATSYDEINTVKSFQAKTIAAQTRQIKNLKRKCGSRCR